MHIYAFGSICRGDLWPDSDVDLLALVDGREPRLNADKFSIYSYGRIGELWTMGNAFAWHLALESRLIYAEDEKDHLRDLGDPSPYINAANDCRRFRCVFSAAVTSIRGGSPSLVFELSNVFLAIRNIATCFSLACSPNPTFGRDSARNLGARNVPISSDLYSTLRNARILSTRGMGQDIVELGLPELIDELECCRDWIDSLCSEVELNG